MASGNTLCAFSAAGGFFSPTSNMATPDTRNLLPVLDFDTTTQEAAYFLLYMPEHYAGGGVTVELSWMASTATSGTIGWDVAAARLNDNNQDVDAYAFDTAATITAATVDATAGQITTTSVNIAAADFDDLAAGEWFILRVRRDVANDNAAGDAELIGGHIKEQ